VEIWREEWLTGLERYKELFPSPLAMQDKEKISIENMKTHGSLEDILNMIEDGDQGEHLRERVNAIRQDSNLMGYIRDLWDK
jgi:hypothetical protein